MIRDKEMITDWLY